MRSGRFVSIPRDSGVYRLYAGETCIWVGSSQNVRQRIMGNPHIDKCDRWEFELVPMCRLEKMEQQWMDHYNPTLNSHRRVSRRGESAWRQSIACVHIDAEISAALNLYAESTGKSASQVVQRALKELLDRATL